VALARRFREAEGLLIAQMAGRLGRSPATIKVLLLRPHPKRRADGEGTRRWGVPALRRHPAALRQGGRLPVLRALPSQRDPAEVDVEYEFEPPPLRPVRFAGWVGEIILGGAALRYRASDQPHAGPAARPYPGPVSC